MRAALLMQVGACAAGCRASAASPCGGVRRARMPGRAAHSKLVMDGVAPRRALLMGVCQWQGAANTAGR